VKKPVIDNLRKQLYNQLDDLRRRVAFEIEQAGEKLGDRAGWLLFSNEAIERMADILPQTTAEFIDIEGVGKKRGVHAPRFIAAIKEFMQQHPELLPVAPRTSEGTSPYFIPPATLNNTTITTKKKSNTIVDAFSKANTKKRNFGKGNKWPNNKRRKLNPPNNTPFSNAYTFQKTN